MLQCRPAFWREAMECSMACRRASPSLLARVGGREVDETRAVSGRVGGFLAAFSKEEIGATTPSAGTQDVS